MGLGQADSCFRHHVWPLPFYWPGHRLTGLMPKPACFHKNHWAHWVLTSRRQLPICCITRQLYLLMVFFVVVGPLSGPRMVALMHLQTCRVNQSPTRSSSSNMEKQAFTNAGCWDASCGQVLLCGETGTNKGGVNEWGVHIQYTAQIAPTLWMCSWIKFQA